MKDMREKIMRIMIFKKKRNNVDGKEHIKKTLAYEWEIKEWEKGKRGKSKL